MIQNAGFIMFLSGILLLILEVIIFLIEFAGETFTLGSLYFLIIPVCLILVGLKILEKYD